MNGESAVELDFQPLARLLTAAWIMQGLGERSLHQPGEDSNADLPSPAHEDGVQVSSVVSVAPFMELTAPEECPTDAGAFRRTGLPNPSVTLGEVISAAEPLLVLMMIVAFLLSVAWDHTSSPASEARTLLQVIQPTVSANSISPVATTASEPVVATRSEGIGKRLVDPAFPSTHLQVTDPATASVLHDLSRYEIEVLRHRAEYGDDAAAFTLGMAFEAGRLVPQSCAQAARWVETSANTGNAAAGYNLGLRYKYGDGVRADPDEAAKWLHRAAVRGYPKGTRGSRPHHRHGVISNIVARRPVPKLQSLVVP